MTVARRLSKGCFGRKPAVTASCIIAKMRGLAAMSAPRCVGPAMSRALLYPIPDWLGLSVACSELSSVNPRKSLSRDRCPTLSKTSAARFFLRECVATHPEDVVDTANAKALANECKFCPRILAQLNTLVHSSSDICFGQELIRNELTGSHSERRNCTACIAATDRRH